MPQGTNPVMLPTMDPHLTLLSLNAILLILAYGVVYPRLRLRDLMAMARMDLIFTGVALGFAALLYAGDGLRFSLILFDTNWAVFTFVTMLLIEVPLFLGYCRHHGISLTPPDSTAGSED